MKISVIVINYNTAEMTTKAIRQLLRAEPDLALEIILIDNGSSEPIVWTDKIVPVITINNKENRGFAAAANQGIAAATGDMILLLNSDVLVSEGAISTLADYLRTHPEVGIIGPRFAYPDNRFQPSAGYRLTLGRELMRFSTIGKLLPGSSVISQTPFNKNFFTKPQKVDWLSGGCLLIAKKVFEKIGALDEAFFFSVEDLDFCLRAERAGFKIIYYPLVSVIHYHGLSAGGYRHTKRMAMEKNNIVFFLKKHFPRNIILRTAVRGLYQAKILFFRYVLKK